MSFEPKDKREQELRKRHPAYNKQIVEETLTALSKSKPKVMQDKKFTGLEADVYLTRSLEDDIEKFSVQVGEFSRKKDVLEERARQITNDSNYISGKRAIEARYPDKACVEYMDEMKALEEQSGLGKCKEDQQNVNGELAHWGSKKDSFSVVLEMWQEQFYKEKKGEKIKKAACYTATALLGLALGIFGGISGNKVYTESLNRDREMSKRASEEALSRNYAKLQADNKNLKKDYDVLVSSNTSISARAGELEDKLKNQKPKYIDSLSMCDRKKMDMVKGRYLDDESRFEIYTESKPVTFQTSNKMEFSSWNSSCMRRFYLGEVLKQLPESMWSKDDANGFARRKIQVHYKSGAFSIISGKGTRKVELPMERVRKMMSIYSSDYQ